MMKKSFFAIALFFLVSISVISGIANAFWIWTPETKKFTNPKYAVKDSPKEQFDWAMSFYNAKDFKRAATEFEKLAKQYEFSEHASKAQYYVGLCYENMNKYYLAYQNYQKAIDNFPHIANTEEILAREFAIGNLYLSKPGPKILGTDIMAPLDRAVEIFKKIVENAPYGKFAAESQFNLGEALKKSERYEEAVGAFHKVVEDYPKSKFATKAMYEESQCAYKASLRPAYDAEATDNAIKTFEKFVDRNKDAKLAEKADATMRRLKDNVSEKSFKAAQFYEAQGKTEAAIIYYQDVLDTYPDSTFVERARARIVALKARTTKKAAAPVDPIKKKSKQVVRQKKSWNPFNFKSEKKETDKEVPQASVKKALPKKKPWNLFNFGAKKEAVVKEASPKKKAWKPFRFDIKKPVEPKEALKASVVAETPVVQAEEKEIVTAPVETPVAEGAPQTTEILEIKYSAVEPPAIEPYAQPLESPAIATEEKEVVAAQVKEAPRAKAWKPFNFENKKDPLIKEVPKNKGWKPLYFGTNDEPMAATNRRW